MKEIGNMTDIVVLDVLGVALLPVITQSIAQGNYTGILGILMNLLPVFYVIGLVVYNVEKFKRK